MEVVDPRWSCCGGADCRQASCAGRVRGSTGRAPSSTGRVPSAHRRRGPCAKSSSASSVDANRGKYEQVLRLRGLRPAGPPPRPALEPVRVQRLADHTGVVSVCGQRVGAGRAYARRTLTVVVSDTTLAIELDDGDSHVVRRTTTIPATTIKARSPGRSPQKPRPTVADQLA